MSDEHLRDLERRSRRSGSPEDEAAWLRERVRVGQKLDWESYSRLHELDVQAAAECLRWRVRTGDLSQEKLELAAYCGHEGARKLAQTRSPTGELVDLVEGIRAGWGQAGVLSALLGPACEVLPSWERAHPGDPRPRNALEAACAWLLDPCEARASAADLASEDADRAAIVADDGDDPAASGAAYAAYIVAEVAARQGGWEGETVAWLIGKLSDLLGPDLVRSRLTSTAISWALGAPIGPAPS